jgi:hypothetical protein
MSTPVTTFDEQYSDPAATATGWEETRRALEEAELFWISTVRADGRPHVTPCSPTPKAIHSAPPRTGSLRPDRPGQQCGLPRSLSATRLADRTSV